MPRKILSARKRRTILNIKITPQERADLKRRAKAAGQTVSAYLREKGLS
jgi:hypothetical protein